MATAARLILFDIDGTLMGAAGAGRRALKVAMERAFGPLPHLDTWTFAGKTDPQIYRELLAPRNLDPALLASRMDAVMDEYLTRLETEMAASPACHLKPGIEPQTAQSEMSAIMGALAEEYPGNAGMGILLEPLKETAVGDMRATLLLLGGAVLLVLLIVCANVAGLLVARMSARGWRRVGWN